MDGRMLSVHKSVYGGCGGEKLYYMTRLTFSRKILPLGGKQVLLRGTSYYKWVRAWVTRIFFSVLLDHATSKKSEVSFFVVNFFVEDEHSVNPLKPLGIGGHLRAVSKCLEGSTEGRSLPATNSTTRNEYRHLSPQHKDKGPRGSTPRWICALET